MQDFELQVTSPRSLLVSWLPPERVYWQGVVEHYAVTVIRLGPVGEEQAMFPNNMTVLVKPQTNRKDPSLALEPLQRESHVLDNLEEYFEYSFSVAMVNTAGVGEPSTPVMQNMPPAS